MNTEDLEKELKKLSRPDLNAEAKKTYGIENSGDFPNAEALIKAVIATTQKLDEKGETKEEGNVEKKSTDTKEDKPADSEEEEETEKESLEIPVYNSTKKVRALKIGTVIRNNKGSAKITPEKEEFEPFNVDSHYLRKYNPRSGGYYKVYEDGSLSYENAETFEAGYELESEQ